MALIPFIVKYMLYWTENALFSMLFFQMMIAFGPIIYLKTISPKKIRKREFIKNDINNLKQQCFVGAILGILALIGTVVAYIAYVTLFSSYLNNFTLFFSYDTTYLTIMGFFFAFVNPILEELFWRIFIPQSLLVVKQYRLFHEDE